MKTIGLLGGMSWESSVEYERLINTEVRDRLGGTHSADLIIRSYDFAVIEELQERDDWEAAGRLLAADATRLEAAGADLVVLCTNTMHRVAPAIQAAITVPLVHIADATATAIEQAGLQRVALLGTRYTMEQEFYRGRLAAHGLDIRIPEAAERDMIHSVIFDELVQGEVREASRERYLSVIERMMAAGAEGVIAGCTEIELLVPPAAVPYPYFPTTALHARAAVEAAFA